MWWIKPNLKADWASLILINNNELLLIKSKRFEKDFKFDS